MSYSAIRYVADGVTNTRLLPWPYRYKEDVLVTVDGIATAISEWVTPSTIRFGASPAAISGKHIEITRHTTLDEPAATFVGGGLDYNDLNNVTEQMLFAAQEATFLNIDANAKYDVALGLTTTATAAANAAAQAAEDATAAVDAALTLAQGPQGIQGPPGTNGADGAVNAVSFTVVQSLDATQKARALSNLGAGILATAAPAVQTATGAFSLVASHLTKAVLCSGTFTVGAASAAALGAGFFTTLKCLSGSITFDPNGSETVEGAATFVLGAGFEATFISDGTNWRVIGYTPPDRLAVGSAINTTSGTFVDVVPTGVAPNEVRMAFAGVKTSGTSALTFQLGSGGSLVTSGYGGSVFAAIDTSTSSTANGSSRFDTNVAANTLSTYSGEAIFRHLGSNIWSANISLADGATGRTLRTTGSVTLPGALDKVRLSTVLGTPTFTAGVISPSFLG